MIIVEVRYEGGGLRGQTRISDISETGVYDDVMSPLPIGVPLQLEFRLPGVNLCGGAVVCHWRPLPIFAKAQPQDTKTAFFRAARRDRQ